MSPLFLLVTSSGPAADHQGDMLGLYRKTEKIKEGRSVYMQEHDSKYGDSPRRQLFSHKRVWVMTLDGNEHLRAATPSESPTSAKWQYIVDYKLMIYIDDPALTVICLSEKPSSECEVTISLSQDIVTDILKPAVAGVYRADGSYHQGRPVLQHPGGLFTLSVYVLGHWEVQSGVGGVGHLWGGSAKSQCPADPRAARHEREGQTNWRYYSKRTGWTESQGISVKCNKCIK